MKIRIAIFLILFSVLFFAVQHSFAQAATEPNFPACTNPAGQVIANYDSGVHGIVGESGIYTGKDTVYRLNDDQVTQCFCPDNGGNGIQTNWWKTSQLSQNEIDAFKRQGWVLIPNGSLWGLDGTSYLAKNFTYSCNGGVGGYSNPGSVLGASTLAATGSIQNRLIAITFALGIIVVLRRIWKLVK